MSDTSTHTTETTTERKPPTLADIVREKTDDGKRIIDFFLDVMEDRIDGAELCHRIDAAKQLEKHKSKAAAKFLAEYRGVSCGHSINGRPNPADPCSAAERSLVAVTLNAPATLTQDFLTVLSGIDEFLMARLIRAQTADGVTVIEFLDDVMQDRNDGFKSHHRIAAAKELIVHIVRDEQPVAGSVHPEPGSPEPVERVEGSVHPEPVEGSVHPELVAGSVHPELVAGSVHPELVEGSVYPEPVEGSVHPELVEGSVHPEPVEGSVHPELVEGSVHPEPVEGSVHPELVEGSVHPEPVEGSVHPEPVEGSVHPEPVEGSVHPEPVEGSVHPELVAGSVHPEPRQIVIPAESLPRTRYGAGTHPPDPAQGPQDHKVRRTGRRRTRTQRRRDGNARAAMLGKHPTSERNKKDQQDKPAPVELTPAERRIRERLEQHWHEPDPYGAPIDSTHPGRSPPC